MELTDQELTQLLYFMTNAGLFDYGTLYPMYVGSSFDSWRSRITLGKVRVESCVKAGSVPFTFSKVSIYIRRRVLWIFWEWVPASGDGPWWDAIRKAFPKMKADISASVEDRPSETGAEVGGGELSLANTDDSSSNVVPFKRGPP